jgi:hypothetical protein
MFGGVTIFAFYGKRRVGEPVKLSAMLAAGLLPVLGQGVAVGWKGRP